MEKMGGQEPAPQSVTQVGEELVLSTIIANTKVQDEACQTLLTADIITRIQLGMEKDPQAKAMMASVQNSKTIGRLTKFRIQYGMLLYSHNRVYVPKWDGLRKELLKECHDSPWAGHPGRDRTVALIKRGFYWPNMFHEVEQYVRSCLLCQQDKSVRRKPAGLLEPLPIPVRPWVSVSMDFITKLPEKDGYSSIMVVVDRFSKYATFVPCKHPCEAPMAAQYFFSHVVKYWGIPLNIVSDRDTRFTSNFWIELFRLMGTKLLMSSAHHPQTDGQTERINGILEEYLRHYVLADQSNWPNLLDMAQFSYNMQKSASSRYTPFELATGRQPIAPHSVLSAYYHASPAPTVFMQNWKEKIDQAREYLLQAQARMKAEADEGRRPLELEVGQQVLLRIDGDHFKPTPGTSKTLTRRYDGPYKVLARIGKAAYRIELPEHMHLHPMFHVSQLRPFVIDVDEPGRALPTHPPAGVIDKPGKVVAKVKGMQKTRWGNSSKVEYLVSWEGSTCLDDTWERAETLWDFEDKIQEYLSEAFVEP